MNPFAQKVWHRVALVSELPNLDDEKIASRCKAFRVVVGQSPVEADLDVPGDLKDQVMVFKYKDKVHAIDHVSHQKRLEDEADPKKQCPHSAFPLSQGSLFDIEDFGITLSTGITCPKHNWSFDIISGHADRGNYRLKVWEVQLRDCEGTDKEVWVRRKQRIG
ncbi:uncharacterized protein N7511_003576 [Penicillium nucicola]|uniref:uncharacterized protein n=1 Tax=Penicillium nucicola TaxID=1850975 RepID=UPI002545A4A1|nr:uncharacterized protein N7511_003576 [Penicillium nucicola]KAJ5765960.1 hypothetical protein N7511_003576 [Penicillium nucicola]